MASSFPNDNNKDEEKSGEDEDEGKNYYEI